MIKLKESKLNEGSDKEQYVIIKSRNGRDSETSGTLEELTKSFGYTLETGKSYESEKGNYKINTKPKTIDDLVKNLNRAQKNLAANGNPSSYYEIG